MELGLFGINMGPLRQEPQYAVEVARAAESAGWKRVDRGALRPSRPGRCRFAGLPDTAMLDPFVALANIAAHTTTRCWVPG